jgi:hypothetical protein
MRICVCILAGRVSSIASVFAGLFFKHTMFSHSVGSVVVTYAHTRQCVFMHELHAAATAGHPELRFGACTVST